MSARETATPATVEDVIAQIRALPRGERQRLLNDEELLTGLTDSLKRSKATPLIAARLLPDALKIALSGWAWNRNSRRQLGLSVTARVYMQDPVGEEDGDPRLAPKPIEIDWEPCLTAGPTSSRVIVIDRDAAGKQLAPPAVWDAHRWAWVMPRQDGQAARRVPADRNCPQFRQINAWAVVESALAYYEDPAALGRAIPWGFEGNRLIVVPHAGNRANAYYDRASKSLLLHTCGPADRPIYTCLSHDIVAHEAGHAILDGIRPRYNERGVVETAAFHEYIADLTAILTLFRDNDFRRGLSQRVGAALEQDHYLTAIGEQFGQYVANRPYIRSARNTCTMADAADDWSEHDRSQVLTGAMFEIMVKLAAGYRDRQLRRSEPSTGAAATGEQPERPRDSLGPLWSTALRMSRLAIQPLDFLPPVDVRFSDYAEAVLAYDTLIHREDPHRERAMMRAVFEQRGILRPLPPPVAAAAGADEADDAACDAVEEDQVAGYQDLPRPPCARLRHVSHIADICDSRTAAYRFLAQHRGPLGIPLDEDFHVPEPYSSQKLDAMGNRLPRHYFIQYTWREQFTLPDDARLGHLRGKPLALPCGGTLVYDENGNFLYWALKPGMQGDNDRLRLSGRVRRMAYQAETLRLMTLGQLALHDAGGLPGEGLAPVVARLQEGAWVLESTPRAHPV